MQKAISLFRKEQNELVRQFALQCEGLDVVEFGGDIENNYRQFFNKASSFTMTNLKGVIADEVQDLTCLNYKDGTIDAVICISVLQHVYELDTAIDEIVRVLKPGGKCLITNGYLFPICMEHDYFRLTPAFWKKRLENEPIEYEVIKMGNKYAAINNLLMRPYGQYKGIKNLINKLLAVPFGVIYRRLPQPDSAPLGVAVILIKQ